MKRTQMIGVIGQAVIGWMYDNQIEGINLGTVDKLCNEILNKIESKGMKPPKQETPFIPEVKFSDKYEWEKE